MAYYHGHPRSGLPTARVYRNGSFGGSNSGAPLLELCCFAGLLGLACSNRRFASALAITIVAVVVISCLATLAMSVTGEALLSIFLVGMVIAGVAALFNSKPGGCLQPENDTDAPGFGR